MRYYQKIGGLRDPAGALAQAIRALESYDASHSKTELAHLLPAAQRGLHLEVMAEDVRQALASCLAARRPTMG